MADAKKTCKLASVVVRRVVGTTLLVFVLAPAPVMLPVDSAAG